MTSENQATKGNTKPSPTPAGSAISTFVPQCEPPDISPEVETDLAITPQSPPNSSVTGKDNSSVKNVEVIPAIPVGSKQRTRPTYIEVFTGQAIGVIEQLYEAQEANDRLIAELREARERIRKILDNETAKVSKDLEAMSKQYSSIIEKQFIDEIKRYNQQTITHTEEALQGRLDELKKIKNSIGMALTQYQWTPGKLWLYQWSLVILLIITGIVQAIFIEFYCRWHGSYFISFDLYNPVNVQILSNIAFVNGATTMSMAAEVLVWSSLGVWAQQSYANTMKMLRRKFRFADDGPRYMGIMMRNTSVAAIIVIILRLSQFSLFGVSLDPSNPLAFDFTVGLSFLLGFFGDDAYKILASFKDRVVSSASDKSE